VFIRYNQAAKYYEYDTSAAQNGSGPWAILPLDGNISGGFPANVAYIDRTNTFAVWQKILSSYPIILLTKTDSGVDGKNWRMENLGNFYISSTNDADNAYGVRFAFDRSGGLTIPGAIAVGNVITAGGVITGNSSINAAGQVRGDNLLAAGNLGQIHMYDVNGPSNARMWGFVQPNNGVLYLQTQDEGGVGQANMMEFSRDGIVRFVSQYSKHDLGIYLPYASSNPALLDHYEEGAWTPGIRATDGGVGTSYSIQSGGYTRVGSVVTCDFDFQIQAANWNSGYVLIYNFPFVNTFSQAACGAFSYYAIGGGVISMWFSLNSGTNEGYIGYKASASASVDGSLQVGNIPAGTRFIGTITYRTNT
jgi:hypothetical protein